jgi:hypothetical protein
LNAPTPVSVGVDAGGQLVFVRHDAPDATHRVAVEATLDSWQLDDEWWRQRISRRYVAVMLEGGKRMLLFEDLVTGEWFEQTP